MPDFRSLREAALGPDTYFELGCNARFLRGTCYHLVRWSIPYMIGRFGPDWYPCRTRFICGQCGCRNYSYGFSHPTHQYGRGSGELWPSFSYHESIYARRLSEAFRKPKLG